MNKCIPHDRLFSERIPAHEIREGKTFRKVLLLHLMEKDGALVPSYGFDFAHELPAGFSRIYAAEGDVFAYNAASRRLQCLTTGTRYTNIPEPAFLLPFEDSEGVAGYYTGGTNRVAYLTDSGVSLLGSGFTPAAGVLHRERLFVVSDYRVYYSPALKRDFFSNSAHDPELAGELEVLPGEGKLLSIVSFRDRLYAFRERGLLRLRADGEALNFKAEELPYNCGTLIAGTLALCGDRVVFFTERGLFLFDGNDFTRVEDGALSEIDFSAKKVPEVGYCRGCYSLLVTLKSGETAIFLYDLLEQRASFVLGAPVSFAAGENGFFSLSNRSVYAFTDRGLPASGEPISLLLGFSAGEKRALDGVTMRGTGNFTLRVGERSLEGAAGKRLTLPSPVIGDITLTLESLDETFEISDLELHWRKYDD